MTAVKDTSIGISIREFARRDGCNEKLVRRAIEHGRLIPLANGKLNPADVGTTWRGSRSLRQKVADADPPIADTRTPEEIAKELAKIVVGPVTTKADAEKVKETYLALLRKMEFDEKSGEVVKISAVTKRVGEEYARVRSRLMSIPAEVAPQLAALKTAEEVRDFLETEITQVLKELSADDGRAGS